MRRWFSSQVHICLVGAFVLSLGVFSAVSLLADWILGEGGFRFGFLLIFIGLGLLRGSSLQRSLFGGLIALGLIVAIIVLGFTMTKEGHSFGEIGWRRVVILAIIVGGYLYGFFVLWSARNDSWFAEKYGRKAPVFVIPLTIVLTLFYTVGIEWQKYENRAAFEEVYPYDFDFKVTDAQTGKLLERVSVGVQEADFSATDPPTWMTRRWTSWSNNDELTFSIHGYGKGAFFVSVGADGYEEKKLEVSQTAKSPIEVALKAESKK